MTGTPPAALIDVSGLRLTLAGRQVLDISALAIPRGELVLLTGANGAGKTSLLKVLAGLLRADAGAFRCLGATMSPVAAQQFIRGRYVYLHQTPYLFDGSVTDNLAYGLRQHGHDQATRRIEIAAALEWAGLEHLAGRRARELSAGERQRVALTRARLLNPPLLLLDEITANMDAASRERTYVLIESLRRSGSGIVFATHAGDDIDHGGQQQLELISGRLADDTRGSAAVIPLRRDGDLS